MLSAHPQACATTELRLYNKYVAPWLEAWQGGALLSEEGKHYIGLQVFWTEGEFHSFLKAFIEQVFVKVLAAKFQASDVLHKRPNYSAFVEDILFFVRQLHFIHHIRDGRDVTVSLAAASPQMGWFAHEPLPDYGALGKCELLAVRKNLEGN
jgi:hypothetical protein